MCILFRDELWHLAVVVGTPYTSTADFSADTSHLSGGGGIVTSQHVAVTIRLPPWFVPSSSSSPPNVMSTSSSSPPPSMREFLGFSRHHTTSGQPVRSSEEQGARRGVASSVVRYTFTPLLRVRSVLFLFDRALLCHTHLYFPWKRSSNLAAAFVITAHHRTPVLSVF